MYIHYCSRYISEPKNSPALVSGLDICNITLCSVHTYTPSQGSGITDYRQEKRDSAVLRSQSVSKIYCFELSCEYWRSNDEYHSKQATDVPLM